MENARDKGEGKGAADEAAGAPNCHVTSRLTSGACRTARPIHCGAGRGAGMVERVHREPWIKACARALQRPDTLNNTPGTTRE
jgi:hypothetical protein